MGMAMEKGQGAPRCYGWSPVDQETTNGNLVTPLA